MFGDGAHLSPTLRIGVILGRNTSLRNRLDFWSSNRSKSAASTATVAVGFVGRLFCKDGHTKCCPFKQILGKA